MAAADAPIGTPGGGAAAGAGKEAPSASTVIDAIQRNGVGPGKAGAQKPNPKAKAAVKAKAKPK